MPKSVCIKCGKELKLGKFAHNQNTCWDCFKDKFLEIRNRVAQDKEELDILSYTIAVVAEMFGEKW